MRASSNRVGLALYCAPPVVIGLSNWRKTLTKSSIVRLKLSTIIEKIQFLQS
jgi:hypothetical protein